MPGRQASDSGATAMHDGGERKGVGTMKLTRKDLIATLLIAAVVVPYVGYLIWGEMPFIQDPRGMAAVGIVGLLLGFVAWGLGLRSMFGKVMLVLGVATLGLGIAAALVGAEGSELLLATFVGAIVLMWAVETAHDAGLFGTGAHAR
jgi:hypothetical protein